MRHRMFGQRSVTGAVVLAMASWMPTPAQAQGTLWQSYFDAGMKALGERNTVEAHKLMLAAIKEAEPYGQSDPRFVASYNSLALILHVEGRTTEALPLSKWAVRRAEAIYGSQHIQVARIAVTLAIIEGALGNAAEAVALRKRGLAIMERELGPNHPELEPSLNGLADAYEGAGQPALADPLRERSLSLLIASKGPLHADVASALHWHGEMHSDHKRYAAGRTTLSASPGNLRTRPRTGTPRRRQYSLLPSRVMLDAGQKR